MGSKRTAGELGRGLRVRAWGETRESKVPGKLELGKEGVGRENEEKGSMRGRETRGGGEGYSREYVCQYVFRDDSACHGHVTGDWVVGERVRARERES